MTAQLIDRRALKAETRETLAEAQVSPKAFTALYLALVLAMNLVDSFTGIGMLATFVSILKEYPRPHRRERGKHAEKLITYCVLFYTQSLKMSIL